MPTEEQLRQMQEMRDDQEPVMLQTWLHGPEDAASATDAWSSERAIAKPRPRTSDSKLRQNKTKKDDVSKAA